MIALETCTGGGFSAISIAKYAKHLFTVEIDKTRYSEAIENAKIPGLFVYFNVNSFEYQNKIISLLAFGWAAFFFLGFKLINSKNIKLIILHII